MICFTAGPSLWRIDKNVTKLYVFEKLCKNCVFLAPAAKISKITFFELGTWAWVWRVEARPKNR